VKVSLPKLEDLIRQVTEYNGFTLDYVRVADANRLLEECGRLQEEAEAVRQVVLLGCEAPPEQLREHTTAALLATRWIPVKDHNDAVGKLERERDEAREAAREIHSWFFSSYPDGPNLPDMQQRWPWLEEASAPLPPASAEIGAQAETDESELDRFRVALMHYAERNHWGYSDVLSPDRVEDVFIASRATGEPGWKVAEEALK
jgi:hypothetical protein